MVRLNWFQRFYWERLAKPASDRELFRHLISTPIASVLEIGIGAGDRMRRIAKLVRLPNESNQLRYIGVDSFESAVDGRVHLTLRQTHQLALQLGFKATLMPGEISSTIPRVASKIGACDLVIVDGGIDPVNVVSGPIGPWVRHITHSSSTIFGCAEPGGTLRRVSLSGMASKSAA